MQHLASPVVGRIMLVFVLVAHFAHLSCTVQADNPDATMASCSSHEAGQQLAGALHRLAEAKRVCGAVPAAHDYVVCTHLLPSDAPTRTDTCRDTLELAQAINRWLNAFEPNVHRACELDTNCRPMLARPPQASY